MLRKEEWEEGKAKQAAGLIFAKQDVSAISLSLSPSLSPISFSHLFAFLGNDGHDSCIIIQFRAPQNRTNAKTKQKIRKIK